MRRLQRLVADETGEIGDGRDRSGARAQGPDSWPAALDALRRAGERSEWWTADREVQLEQRGTMPRLRAARPPGRLPLSRLSQLSHRRLSSSSPPPPPAAGCRAATAASLAKLRAELDANVVGQDEVKRAILLGLLAREHVYIEGPPGVAKTRLSEVAAQATGSTVYAYQFHRDSRLDELVGDRVVVREPAGDGAELIRQTTRKGGLLTAEICVLDDISRAPGEALNVLLRLLNERRWTDGSSIPLVSAIATANPPRDDYFNEPLDPANLDRFTLQVKAGGLVQSKQWQHAARVVEQFGTMPHTAGSAALSMPAEEPDSSDSGGGSDNDEAGQPEDGVVDLAALHAAHGCVEMPVGVQRLVLLLLAELVTVHGCIPANSLLTDRTFLVKAPRIMQAAAMLDGRGVCTPEDLHALTLLTTFRVPEPVQEKMHSIIEEIIQSDAQQDEEGEGAGEDQAGGPGGEHSPSTEMSKQQQKQQKEDEAEERKNEEQRRKEREEMMKALNEDGGLLRTDGVEKAGAAWSLEQKYPRVHDALKKLTASIMTGGEAPVL